MNHYPSEALRLEPHDLYKLLDALRTERPSRHAGRARPSFFPLDAGMWLTSTGRSAWGTIIDLAGDHVVLRSRSTLRLREVLLSDINAIVVGQSAEDLARRIAGLQETAREDAPPSPSFFDKLGADLVAAAPLHDTTRPPAQPMKAGPTQAARPRPNTDDDSPWQPPDKPAA